MWAIVRVDDRFYAFSFSVDSLVSELVASVQRANEAAAQTPALAPSQAERLHSLFGRSSVVIPNPIDQG